jgi:hypothetical protein
MLMAPIIYNVAQMVEVSFVEWAKTSFDPLGHLSRTQIKL